MSIFALADCNNFYASCERIFRPGLSGQPIVVLSNNDGCIIARSNEAKALGIKMGAPYFKMKELIESNGVHVFSSNYTLYGDMSSRVMSVLAECTPDLEVYSIDEAFMLLDGYPDLKAHVQNIRMKVQQYTGITVSIGVGPTKTLAKLANNIAKKFVSDGVFSLNSPQARKKYFDHIDVQDVWGIGRQIGKQLHDMHVRTVTDFIRLDPGLVRKKFSITLLRTQMELQGESCIALEEIPPVAKGIASTRSFGKNVATLEDLQASATLHVSRLAEKLRFKNRGVKSLYIFALNNRFSTQFKPRVFSCTVGMPYVTNSTAPLLKAVSKGLESIYEEGVIYKKLGVIASELLPVGLYEQDLFAEAENPKYQIASQVMDKINCRYGRNKIYYSTLGTRRDWLPQDKMRSAHYTTDIQQILQIN